MTKNKIKGLIYLQIYFYISLFIGLIFKLNYINLILIFGLLPSLYLATRIKDFLNKATLESLIISIPIVFIVDHMSHINKTWYIPDIFGIRVFRTFPIEEFISAFVIAFSLLTIYSYFFDKYKKHNLSKNFKNYTLISIVLLIIFFIIYLVKPNLLIIPYFYFWFMLIIILITLFILLKFPRLYTNVSIFSCYTFLPLLSYELIALKLKHWEFMEGNHIGYISILNYKFPVEEGLFLVFIPFFIALIHEFFADNKRSQ